MLPLLLVGSSIPRPTVESSAPPVCQRASTSASTSTGPTSTSTSITNICQCASGGSSASATPPGDSPVDFANGLNPLAWLGACNLVRQVHGHQRDVGAHGDCRVLCQC